jgi:hypothetical protein
MKMMNEKSKAKSASSAGFSVKAGSAKMSGPNYVGPQTPGQSTSGGQKSNPPVKGGRTGVMGKQGGAAPAMPGMNSCGGRAGDNSFVARGGGRKMAGFTPAPNAKAL